MGKVQYCTRLSKLFLLHLRSFYVKLTQVEVSLTHRACKARVGSRLMIRPEVTSTVASSYIEAADSPLL